MKTLLWSVLAAALIGPPGLSQDFRANILGQVVDTSRSAIPSATVTAIKEDTNVTRDTRTNAEGMYTLVGLDPGQYTITITAAGFTTVRRSGILLQVAEKLNLPVVMGVGQETEAITVVGEQEIIQTATASRGLVLDPTKMEELPVPGRTVFMLMQL